jgi:hypothetical protein
VSNFFYSVRSSFPTGIRSLEEELSQESDIRSFVFAIAGLLYGISLAILGWFATGAGHGTFFFFSLAVFPYGIGLILWPLIGWLLADSRAYFQRILFIITIIFRYALIVIYVLFYGSSEIPYIAVTWRYSRFAILAPVALFLIGQLLIWAIVLGRILQTRQSVAMPQR